MSADYDALSAILDRKLSCLLESKRSKYSSVFRTKEICEERLCHNPHCIYIERCFFRFRIIVRVVRKEKLYSTPGGLAGSRGSIYVSQVRNRTESPKTLDPGDSEYETCLVGIGL